MTPQKMLEDLKSGALRLVPGEWTDEMQDAFFEELQLAEVTGICGDEEAVVQEIIRRDEAYRAALAASPDLGPALVEMIEGLVREREAARADRDDVVWDRGKQTARALAAERERDALREALAPMAAVASDIPDDWSDGHQCVTACGHFRRAARALKEAQP